MKLKYILIMLLTVVLIPAMVSAQNISITSSPVLTGEVGVQYQYQVNVDNTNNYTLSYFIDGPSGMNINSTGKVTWTPSAAGVFPVNITVSNTTKNVSQVYDLQVTATPSQISATAVELGSNNQRRGETLTTTYEISNTGSFDITNLNIEFINIADRYNVQGTLPSTTIPAQGSILASISAEVPENQDSGRVRLGQIVITGSSDNTVNPVTRDVFLTTENKLVIESIEVTVDGRRERLDEEGAIRREANLGDRIELTLRIRNDFDDLDIEDIEAELFSLGIDDADGEISTLRRLRPQRTSTDLRFDFVLEANRVDIEDAPFELEIVLFGMDENNARHGETWILELELERRNRDVRLINTIVNPSLVNCQNTFFAVNTDIYNIGTRDLSSAMVQVNIPELNIQEFRRNLDLFTGDTRRVSFNLNIPSTTTPGQYIVEVYAHPTLTISDFTDTEVLTLTVGQCPTDVSDEEDTSSNGLVVQPTSNETPVVVGVPVSQTTTTSSIFENQQTYLIILGVLVVLLLITVIILLAKLL
ncbi:MAG: hypothetical protein ACMXX9_00080 [Candidatus Woesearchaeota archaeon]